MKETTARKIKWVLGVLGIWGSGWALLGVPALMSIQAQPHPFLKGMKLTGVMLTAVATWAFTTLLAYLAIGLLTGFIALVGINGQGLSHFSFKRGCLLGCAVFFWFHGVLYTQVPGALGSIPGVNKLPMALCLLILLGAGAGLMARSVWLSARNCPWLRWSGILVALALFIHLPHDVFRRLMPGPSVIPAGQRKLVIVSIDGLRRDTFEQAMPEWKIPSGTTPICAFPATRLAWNALFGASVDRMRFGRVMPYESELRNPDQLTLLRSAEIRGLRTAFLINDSLTPSYSLTPTLFTTVLEPEGGWKYWFTLGFGTSWPVHSWLQNYLSPVETSNPWCNTDAYYRDIGRQLRNHAWVSSHNCELHAPIVLKFEELRVLSGWKWLGRSAYSYQPYVTFDEIQQDGGVRLGPRASAQRHFNARSGSLLARLKPFIAEWEHEFPQLSGVVTADHGETFQGIFTEDHQLASTFSGVHGFRLDADTIHIPLHPFGRTTVNLKSGSLFSWLDLRDNIDKWLQQESPLNLESSQDSRIIQITAIQPAHLEPEPLEQPAPPKNSATNPRRGGGIEVKELMRTINLRPDGLWYCNDLTQESMGRSIFSTALVRGSLITLFNPEKDGTFYREDWDGYTFLGAWKYDRLLMDQDIQAFKALHQLPEPPKD